MLPLMCINHTKPNIYSCLQRFYTSHMRVASVITHNNICHQMLSVITDKITYYPQVLYVITHKPLLKYNPTISGKVFTCSSLIITSLNSSSTSTQMDSRIRSKFDLRRLLFRVRRLLSRYSIRSTTACG